MKVFLLSDYFFPFNPGGSEWSVFEIAKSLKPRGVNPVIITLNYGSKNRENYKGIKIIRLPFFKKLNEKRQVVSPMWQNNPLFFIQSTVELLKTIIKEKPDVIHTHGKFLIPAAYLAGAISKKPVVVSIRDKQILCSIGKCFFEKNRKKACGFLEYINEEIPWFFENYTKNKNSLNLTYLYLGAIWSRLSFSFIKFLARKARVVIAISNSQKSYLEKNGFKNVQVIYNLNPFMGVKHKISDKKTVLFAGKASKGKGAELLFSAIENILKKGKIKFLFAGGYDKNSDIVKKMIKKVSFLGDTSHETLQKLYQNSSLVVMPSIYPEAFGRVALEALACGTPSVVTNIGALPEIIEDKKTGKVVNATPKDLEEGIFDVLKNEKLYVENIRNNYKNLKEKFYNKPLAQHISLYKELT